MRHVIDTNQAAEVHNLEAPPDYHPVLVIPPMSWAEILSGSPDYAIQRLRAIAQYDVRFGMELDVIHDRLRGLTENDIRSFDTVYRVGSPEHQYLLDQLWSPHESFVQSAREMKARASEFAANVEARFAVYKKERHAKKSHGQTLELVKWVNIDEAARQLFLGPDAPYRDVIVSDVSKDGAALKSGIERILFQCSSQQSNAA